MPKERNPNLQPASAEILDEFARVRERFLQMFDLHESIHSDRIDAYFAEHGLTKSPAISIPFNHEGCAAARAVAAETMFPLRSMMNNLSERRGFNDPSRSGVGWSVPAYRLNFVMDKHALEEELYGKERAARIEPMTLAHESAHSAFHGGVEILIGKTGQGRMSIYEKFPLSGMLHTTYSDHKKQPGYMPNWSEEAFASYVAADIFRPDLPEGKGGFTVGHISRLGFETLIPLREHYVVRTSRSSESVGHLAGAVAAETLELLDEVDTTAGVIDDMFGIARGMVDPEIFRKDLRRKLGKKLYGMMFMRHPYSIWSEIWDRVEFPKAYVHTEKGE